MRRKRSGPTGVSQLAWLNQSDTNPQAARGALDVEMRVTIGKQLEHVLTTRAGELHPTTDEAKRKRLTMLQVLNELGLLDSSSSGRACTQQIAWLEGVFAGAHVITVDMMLRIASTLGTRAVVSFEPCSDEEALRLAAALKPKST